MEHRTFGKLLDQLKELTAAQADKVVAALRRRGDGDVVRRVIEQRVSETPKCPRCGRGAYSALWHGEWIATLLLRWLRSHFQRPGPARRWPACAIRNAGHPSPTRSSNRIRCARRRARWGSPRILRSAGGTAFCAGIKTCRNSSLPASSRSTRVLFGKPQRRARAGKRGAQTRRQG